MLLAVVAIVAIALAACTPPPPTTTPDASNVATPPVPAGPADPEVTGGAANRIIHWTKCTDVVWMSDAALDAWKARGAGGFVCKMNYLYGLGGPHTYDATPNAPLVGPKYDMQRIFRDTAIVNRAAARGIKLWIGIGTNSYWEDRTPFAEWFDDTAWATKVLPNMRDLAAGARVLGFAGIAWDEELYAGSSGIVPTWDWRYRGNARPEAEVRAKVRERGAQTMQAIVEGFPGAEMLTIGWRLPEGWEALVQQEINGVVDANRPSVSPNFWDGMTSVNGYGAIRFMDSSFNKGSHLYRSTWDSAFTYNLNRLLSYFSRQFSNWSYASARVKVGPFSWIDSGTRPGFEDPRSPSHVTAQLAAFRRWGMGGAFANYANKGINGFDYTPYIPAMQAASAPGIVETTPPTVAVTAQSRSGGNVTISGNAADNQAIRAVRWRNSAGATGAAPMSWTVTAGDWAVGYQWRMDWSATVPAAPGTRVTITAEDSKGLQSSIVLTAS